MAFSRTILAVGALACSLSIAQAQGDRVEDFPIAPPMPVDRPLLMENFPAKPDMSKTVASTDARRSRHGRKSRFADVAINPEPLRGSMAPGLEAAAPTPAETTVVNASQGKRETGSSTIADLVARHAIENGVPVDLARAVVHIESRGNPRAFNRGAIGLMQIKYGTARAAGFSGGASGLLVAETNLRYGMKVLGDAFRSSGGNVCRALMLYQSGHMATHMTRSNRVYCDKARSVMAGA